MSTPGPARRDDAIIRDEAALLALYGTAHEASIAKEADHLTPEYQALIAASPFMVLASAGRDGLDCSPRGDAPGFVVIEDRKTLLLPDRRGNNRLDTLRNLLVDDRVAMLFMIPGIGETLRVNGRAAISVDPALRRRFAVRDKEPACVLVITVDAVYFQCAKAVVRSRLWDPESRVERSSLPSAGDILAERTQSRIEAADYDRTAPQRLLDTLY